VCIDESIFIKEDENEILALLIMYVDDIWIFAHDPLIYLREVENFAQLGASAIF
jgi:hypothetical protein